ncbi:hypothetical protein ACFQ58_17160 [Agromyces sp. NPDC056523]|uniref:hypothetical protein n=1 Tax=Agromyces sp. NPDC056523 TaxID=3345850 RepID=UPI003672981E
MTAGRRTGDREGYPPPALTVVVLALGAVVFAVLAVVAIGETTARAFASYAAVEATVVDAHDEARVVADRRGSSTEMVRVVRVELPDGTRADLRNEDLEVGATAEVYVSDSGAVFEAPPARPGLLEWALCAAIATAAVVLATLSVRGALRLRPGS